MTLFHCMQNVHTRHVRQTKIKQNKVGNTMFQTFDRITPGTDNIDVNT